MLELGSDVTQVAGFCGCAVVHGRDIAPRRLADGNLAKPATIISYLKNNNTQRISSGQEDICFLLADD
jgi:hypothetical protein